MKNLTKEGIIHTWFFSGLSDLFFAFQLESPFRYKTFMNNMSFEKICKSYLLAENSFEYENLEDKEALKRIDSLVRKKEWGHDLDGMVKKIEKSIGNHTVESLINSEYDGYTGKDIIRTMQAAYMECRYPVPVHIYEEFPIKGNPGMFHDPIESSGIEKFCFAFTRLIIIILKDKYNISIPKCRFYQIVTGNAVVTGNACERFCNLFLINTPNNFLE